MNLEYCEIVEINDKKYTVVSKAEYASKNYVCLTELDNSKNISFFEINDKNELTIVDKDDEFFVTNVVPILLNNFSENIKIIND